MSQTAVRITCGLDAFVSCGPYTAIDKLGVTCSDVRIESLVVKVEMNGKGVLEMLPMSPEIEGTWCDYACAARDRQEQNMEVFLDDSVGGRAAVRTTRKVLRGEELFVWFEDSLARQHHIPILTPANIRGLMNHLTAAQQSKQVGMDEYLCTFCGAVFQRPNPLKSHIRYHCSVHKSLPVTRDFPLVMPTPPDPRLSSWLPGFPAVWGSSPLVLTSPASRSYGRNHQYVDVSGSAVGVQNGGTWWLDYIQQMLQTQTTTVKLRDVTDDATRDVTVTSAGVDPMTSSQLVPASSKPRASGGGGHACSYCGKIYSRRYGLKIHLRTHTGFKPLQCSVCGRPFGDPSNLNKHIRLHAQSAADVGGSAPYRCRHCGKVLVRRRDLDRHVRAKHPDLSDDVSTNEADTLLVTSSEYVSADNDDDDHRRRRLDVETKIAT